MFDFLAVKERLEEANNHPEGHPHGVLSLDVTLTTDQEWICFHELLQKTGVTNPSRACRRLIQKYPDYKESFTFKSFPDKPKETRGLHISQFPQFILDFEVLAKLHPSKTTNTPPEQPELPLPATPAVIKPPLAVQLSYPKPPAGSTGFTSKGKIVAPKTAVQPTNTSPFGWYIDGDVILMIPEECALAHDICVMCAANNDVLLTMKTLNKQGHFGRNNAPWTPVQIQDIVLHHKERWNRWLKYIRQFQS